MQKTAIIIPCYNEEKRIEKKNIDYIINNTHATIFFANDGSKDNTLSILNDISGHYNERCFVMNYEKNEGKANTIFKAIKTINQRNEFDFIGYFDADFSTPPNEIKRLIEIVNNSDYQFVFGSRVLLLNSGIERKWYRHIIGRVIITSVNFKLKLGIYDTQCGAKIFSKEIIKVAFVEPFKTSWLFDMEIFARLKKENCLNKGMEIPIYDWKDVEGSKLGFKTSFKIIKELYFLLKNY
jgi:glycosyltransferase involved in cell wall biosynthesis